MSDSVSVVIAVVVVALFFKYVLLGGPDSQSQTTSINNRTRGRHAVSQEAVENISSMFPAFPRSQIEIELSNGNTVESICEKILSGRLIPLPQAPPTSTPSTLSSSSSSTTNALLNGTIITSEPEKSYKETAQSRQDHLKDRKKWMLQQARKKFLEKQGQ